MTITNLQQELKKKEPFDSLEQAAFLSVLRTADQLQLRFTRLFREHGLTPAQYNILRILRGEGNPLPILEVASRMIQTVPGITGLIDRLEKISLVERKRCEKDRRVVYVSITEQGKQLVSQLDAPVTALHHSLLEHMTPEELQTFVQLSEKMRDPLAAKDS